MFGKSKVKGHSRVSKSKKGFKVIRVNDFFRKKDENRGKKIALGVGTGLLVGAGLLAKKKGFKLPTNIGKEAKNLVVDVKATRVPDTKLLTSGTKKVQNLVEDSWETPILTKLQKENKLVTSKTEGVKLLTPAKSKQTKRRGILQVPQKKSRNIEERIMQVSNAQKDYKSLPVEMQTVLQVEKALRAPTQVSKLGRPPEKTSIVKLVDNSGGKLDKATRKVKDRLKREKAILDETVKKN